MGESVSEATIISWNKNIGDFIELDETIIEIATDKSRLKSHLLMKAS